jgi:predicted ATP-dependent protease
MLARERLSRLLTEASTLAAIDRRTSIAAHDVHTALSLAKQRNRSLQHVLEREIAAGLIALEFTGAVVGQVNALVTYTIGEEHYGLPARITATAGPGDGIMLDIERHVALSGPLHDKGVLVLGGLLRRRYGRERPLQVACSLCFEQSDQVIDGDSASLAEAIAIISAIGELPVRQDFAFTGAIDQRGQIGAVGDVTCKIEGFFQVAQHRNSTCAVVVPKSVSDSIMLNDSALAAVRSEVLTIHAVKTIDEALELACDLPITEIDRCVSTALDRYVSVLKSARATNHKTSR